MNHSRLTAVAGLTLITVFCCSTARAQFKLPNPFSKEPEATAYTLEEAKAKPSSGPSLPKLPKLSLPKAPKLGQSPRLAKINQGTKKFFSGVKDFLTPWDNGKSSRNSYPVTGTRRTYDGSPSARTASRRKGSNGGSPFKLPSLFRRDDAPQKPQSVPDFLKQARP